MADVTKDAREKVIRLSIFHNIGYLQGGLDNLTERLDRLEQMHQKNTTLARERLEDLQKALVVFENTVTDMFH